MTFTETKLKGAFLIDLKRLQDQRGFFARAWCQKDFEKQGLNPRLAQVNLSFNNKKGTLRGMHFQRAPHQECKLVRCTRGALYDVIIDLRRDSPTYKHWIGVELRADNYRMLFVPEDFAHGYQTIEDNTEVIYQVSRFYAPQSEGGVRYNDPAFGIKWPLAVTMISDKDRAWPDYVADGVKTAA
ncbi:MAG TPA: dTDP-4-dehydrorhamnose 3,5-epimerase [Verrucomicrobiae bacterium]|nr:dTDP-4-dehydrorhamnose 3,5-epimerase [Verrucomicrobiae bacterium]